MKRRRLILIGALAAGAALLLLCWPRGPKEPVYQGRRLSEWMREVQGSFVETNPRDNSNAIAKAEKVIRDNATTALPWLMSEFVRRDSKWVYVAREWLAEQSWTSGGIPNQETRILDAARGLCTLGPAVAPALPVLAEYLGDEQANTEAAWVMGAAGEPALPFILKAIAGTNSQVAASAAWGLGIAARHTEAAIEPLVQLLQHTNAGIRSTAATMLGTTCSLTDPVVPALARALSDPDRAVRYYAAHSLGKLGDKAKAAVPELLRLMRDSDSAVAGMTSNALFWIDPAALPPRGP